MNPAPMTPVTQNRRLVNELIIFFQLANLAMF